MSTPSMTSETVKLPVSAEGELRAQHERWSGAAGRLGMRAAPRRVNRAALRPPPVSIEMPVVSREPRRVAPPRVPRDGSWDVAPAVFYDEAADNPPATWQSIIAEACRDHNITKAELMGPRHYGNLARARNEIAYRMTVELDMSLTAIGRRMNRDHTSVLAQLRVYCRTVPGAKARIDAVKARRASDRKAMLERAVELYASGKSYKAILELLPLSKTSIETAVRRAGR